MRDARGETLPLDVFSGRGRSTADSLPLADGKSSVFVVPDTASTLIC